MRQKTIVDGFRNGQRFRYILRQPGTDFEVGMYITIKEMATCFATTRARVAIWDTLMRLGLDRRVAAREGKPVPTGLLRECQGFHCQIDLCD